MEDKGLVELWMEKMFGKSWLTSLLGVLVLIPQILNVLQAWFINIGVSPTEMNSLSLFFGGLAAIASKSYNVTGTNKPQQ